MLTLTIDIPALDRLCDLLERQGIAGIVGEKVGEIRADREPTAGRRKQKPELTEVTPDADHLQKTEAAQEPGDAQAEPAGALPTGAPSEPEPAAPKPVALDAVQRAAAQMRDQGKLKAVTDMFPEFGITKLSDLKGEKLAEFAGRLREMGAAL